MTKLTAKTTVRAVWCAACAVILSISSRAFAETVTLEIFPFVGTNGATPWASVIEGSDGNFYGTTRSGGAYTNLVPNSGGYIGGGTVFRMTPNGEITALASFDGTNGSFPRSPLAEADDGNFYGTAESGGAYPGTGAFDERGAGTVFRITTNGVLTTLFSFWVTNGVNPVAGLARGPDGGLYGSTRAGGSTFGDPRSYNSFGFGTIFKITTNGDFTLLHNFTGGADGVSPFFNSQLMSDDYLYAVGSDIINGLSQVLKILPDGTVNIFTTLAPTIGLAHISPLMESRDGIFYGASMTGGIFNNGGVYKVSRAGAASLVTSFTNADGLCWGSLVEGTDGNLYGARSGSAFSTYGFVFRVTPDGMYQTLASFPSMYPAQPRAGLIQAKDGRLYGTLFGYGYQGQPNEAGAVFRVTVPSAAAPKLRPPSRAPGSSTLTWSAISGRTYQVQFTTNLAQLGWNSLPGTVTATNGMATAKLSCCRKGWFTPGDDF